jgi:uncharacterized protein with GYD domain
MPRYLSRFQYEPQTWAKLIHDPSNRRKGVVETIEAAGGTLIDFWYTTGAGDGYVMFDCPEEESLLAYLAVTYGRGNLRSLETERLFTVEEMVGALEASKGFPALPAPPG